jgi:hypothetical protein
MADRERNVGRLDRIVRAVLGTVGLGLMAWLYLRYPLDPAIVGGLVVLGAFELVTLVGAITGTCGVYAAIGLDTCKCASDSPAVSWGNTR